MREEFQMKTRKNIVLAAVFALLGAVSTLSGCATGKGGGLDGVLSNFDSGAEARVKMREAAQRANASAETLIAIHNLQQESVTDKLAQRKLVKWWLGERKGVVVESIGDASMSEIYSGWEALAKAKPANSDDLAIWRADMERRKALFLAQADVLDAVATRFESTPPANVSEAERTQGIAIFRERATLIRGKVIVIDGDHVTANLIPGDSSVAAVAAKPDSSGASLSKKDVRRATNAASQLNRGNTFGAATSAGQVVFGN